MLRPETELLFGRGVGTKRLMPSHVTGQGHAIMKCTYQGRKCLVDGMNVIGHVEGLIAHGRVVLERLSATAVDKLEAKITSEFFEEMSGKWREEQRRLQRDIERHEEAEQSHMEERLQIL
jgi:hypothetical protein